MQEQMIDRVDDHAQPDDQSKPARSAPHLAVADRFTAAPSLHAADLTQVGPMWHRTADGIDSRIANDQVEIGAV